MTTIARLPSKQYPLSIRDQMTKNYIDLYSIVWLYMYMQHLKYLKIIHLVEKTPANKLKGARFSSPVLKYLHGRIWSGLGMSPKPGTPTQNGWSMTILSHSFLLKHDKNTTLQGLFCIFSCFFLLKHDKNKSPNMDVIPQPSQKNASGSGYSPPAGSP